MEITEVRIKLIEDRSERLKAFCSITLDDCFVVRDLKIIEGSGGPFVAMPSRKLTCHCSHCGSKNHLRASYCNQCGRQLKVVPLPQNESGRIKLYADIAHPINSSCRDLIQKKVIEVYELEAKESQQPDYVSRYDDFGDDWEFDAKFESEVLSETESTVESQPADPPDADEKVDDKTDENLSQQQRRTSLPEQPRGPHKKPETKTTDTHGPHASPGGFGAGIF